MLGYILPHPTLQVGTRCAISGTRVCLLSVVSWNGNRTSSSLGSFFFIHLFFLNSTHGITRCWRHLDLCLTKRFIRMTRWIELQHERWTYPVSGQLCTLLNIFFFCNSETIKQQSSIQKNVESLAGYIFFNFLFSLGIQN